MIGALAGGLSKGQETALRLPLVFMGGMALHLFRDQVRVSLWLLGGLVATTIAAALIAPFAYRPFLFVTTAYAAITLALAPSVVAPRLQPRDDLSYGVYLYGWPVQQALHALFPAMPATLSIAPALATTLLIAFLSWRLIERPALALKPSSRRDIKADSKDAVSSLSSNGMSRCTSWSGRSHQRASSSAVMTESGNRIRTRDAGLPATTA